MRGALLLMALGAVLAAGCRCADTRQTPPAGPAASYRLCVHPGDTGVCTPAEAVDFGLVGDVAPAERAVRLENTGSVPVRLVSVGLGPAPAGFELLSEALRPLSLPLAVGPGAAAVVVVRAPPRAVAGPLPEGLTVTLALTHEAGREEAVLPVEGAWSGCPEGFAACVPGGACETDIFGDARNCGGCGVVCRLANVGSACVKGRCVPQGACASGFGDCDRRGDTGCETPLDTVQNCRGCSAQEPHFACERPHATATCAEAGCQQVCLAERADCDGDLARPGGNGCETDLASSLDHCGACGARCAPENATPECGEGRCRIAACADRFADCDGEVERGCEIEPSRDPAHCGACGRDCADEFPHAETACDEGECRFAGCLEGFVDLDGAHEPGGNGCEYACTRTIAEGATDLPDDTFSDADCDGVDGDVQRAVFVRPGGDDLADGLTPQTAVASPARALAVARATGRNQVLFARGAYTLVRTLEIPSGLSLHGGYAKDFRTRARAQTVLRGPSGGVLLFRDLTAPTSVDGVDLEAADAAGEARDSVAVRVEGGGEHLTLRALLVRAGQGADAEEPAGARGDGGVAGGAQGAGAPGRPTRAAGSSIGLLLKDSTVTFASVTVVTSAGGDAEDESAAGSSIGARLEGDSRVTGSVRWMIGSPGEAETGAEAAADASGSDAGVTAPEATRRGLRCSTWDGQTCAAPGP